MNRIEITLYGLLTAALLAWPFSAKAAEVAGIVIIASGDVQAVQADHSSRALKRRSSFYVGEVIKVAENGKAQIRFTDGTLLSLRPDTEIRVDAFHYEQGGDGAQDKNFFTLLKGGFRTITGAVGKRHPDAYRVSTPVATIGVRGTNYSVAMDKQLYVGVWQGGVTVSNDKGKLDLGMNAAFNFAQIAGTGQTPKGLISAPAILLDRTDAVQAARDLHGESRQQPEKPAAQEGEKKESAANGEAAAAAATEAIPPSEQPGKPHDGTGTVAKPEEGQPAVAISTPGNNGQAKDSEPATPITEHLDETNSPAGFASSKESGLAPPDTALQASPPMITTVSPGSILAAATGGTVFAQPAYTDLNNDGVPDLFTGTDKRLSDAELVSLDRLGLMMSGGNPSPYPILLGKANDGGGGAPLFVRKGVPATDATFDSAAAVDVIRKGGASVAAGTLQTDPVYPVSWGTWNGTTANPVLIQTDSTDPTVTTPLATQVFWITALPTAPTAIGSRTGKNIYRNVIAYQGGSSAGPIGALYMASAIDFATGAVQGDMRIHTSTTDYWDMQFGGTLNSNVLNLSVTAPNSVFNSAVNGKQPANGALDAFFTGANGDAIAGAFDFQTTSGPSSDVDGIFLIDDKPVGDLRLSAAEQGSIDRVGLAVVDNMSTVDPNAAAPLLANATDGAAGSPILVDTALNIFGFPNHVMRQGVTTLTNLQANPSYMRPSDSITVTLPVSWGTWNNDLAGAVVDQYDHEDPLLSAAIASPVNWMAVVPTTAATVAGLTGVVGYTNLIGMIGTSSGGNIVSPSATATVDFGTAAVSGSMNFNTNAGDIWNSNFSGTLSGPALNITSVNGTVNGATPIAGKINGYLTGPRAEGMAGVFDYEAPSNRAIHAEGSFVLGCGTVCP